MLRDSQVIANYEQNEWWQRRKRLTKVLLTFELEKNWIDKVCNIKNRFDEVMNFQEPIRLILDPQEPIWFIFILFKPIW